MMPSLTKQEKQESIRFVEADKPLLDKHQAVDIFGNDTMTIVEVKV